MIARISVITAREMKCIRCQTIFNMIIKCSLTITVKYIGYPGGLKAGGRGNKEGWGV